MSLRQEGVDCFETTSGNKTADSYDGFLVMSDDDVELCVRSFNCLRRAGINSIQDLCKMSPDDLMKVRNLGRKSLEEILAKLEDLGLTPEDDNEDNTCNNNSKSTDNVINAAESSHERQTGVMKKNNVKRLRRSRNLSQTDMAKELKIPQTRISAWELGKSNISKDDLEMLADYFCVSPAYVTGDSMDKYDQEDGLVCSMDADNNEYRAMNYEEIELLECYRYMEGSGKQYLMQTVRMLRKYYGME